MTYRLDPRRKAAQQWHKLLNQGQAVAVVLNGAVIAAGRSEHDPHIRVMMTVHPSAVLIKVSEQL